MNDLHQRFSILHSASRAGPASGAAERRALLRTLRDMVLDARDSIAAAISSDFGGRAAAETELLEIVPVMDAIRHTSGRLPGWMPDERRHVATAFQPARAWIRHQLLAGDAQEVAELL